MREAIQTLAGGVAHEFNNLLAGINGYAALGLRRPDLGPELRGYLERIVALSERAAGLTWQLLAFARQPALARERQPAADLLRDAADVVRRSLGLEVELELPAGEGPMVEADAGQLRLALVHLARNARDALPAAAAPVVLRLRPALLGEEQPGYPQRVPAGDYVVIEVEDRGCGMAPEVLGRAADPFFTTREVGSGTGLGLPLVLGIVQGHHGYLTLDSAPGRGTCVRLYLPRCP